MKKTMIFILAILMAGVTTYLFYVFLQHLQTQPVSQTQSVPMVQVVEAKTAIKAQTPITDKQVAEVSVPKSSVLPDTILTTDKVIGQMASVDLEPSEILLTHQLVSKTDSPTLAYKIKSGDEAFTITSKQIGDTVANLIEPEDYVDLLLIKKGKASVLLSNVLVLAVDQRMLRSKPDDPYKPYSMTTLEVNSDQIMKILNAEGQGSLLFSLHSAQDVKVGGT